MSILFGVYIALSIFGVGVSVMDFLGVFVSSHDAHGGDSGDGADAHGDAGGMHAELGDADSSGTHFDDGGPHGDGGHHGDAEAASDDAAGEHGGALLGHSTRAPGRMVPRMLATLRFSVYAALGSGPTGLFALLSGRGPASSLFWSGVGAAVVSSIYLLTRGILRKELDSTLHEDELLSQLAIISVPVEAGKIGKARLRRYDRDLEVYVRSSDERLSLVKGTEVLLLEIQEGIYIVEAVETASRSLLQ
jgi:hypothetical protein